MFYRIVRIIIWPFVKIFYPYKVINKENITNEGNTIIICNHLQKADVYYTTFTFKGKSYYLSKKEWFKNKFLTKVLNIDKERLAFTVFAGNENAPRDEEAFNYWVEAGVDPSHIFFTEKNNDL